MRAQSLFVRADRIERRLCLFANAACQRRRVRQLFRAVSRLGDGVFWYALMATMPLWQWFAARSGANNPSAESMRSAEMVSGEPLSPTPPLVGMILDPSQWPIIWQVSLQMLIAGAVGLALYKLLKVRLVRERPFIGLIGIECAMPPLDRYSFPSGHTLHAVTFTAIAIHHVPMLAWVLVPFSLLIAASRVVLGLHYPTDVLAGAVLGALIAAATLSWG
jgi:undecaprenyl-diphosphatase